MMLYACKTPPQQHLPCERIHLVESIYQQVATQHWPELAQAPKVPLVYIEDSIAYLAYAPDSLVKKVNAKRVACEHLSLYAFPAPHFAHEFHMEMGIDFLDSCALNYLTPVMYCSSVEVTQHFIPTTKSTEDWAAMVAHEYFHGFQFQHKNIRDFVREEMANTMTADSIHAFYTDVDWFKQSIDKENALLLKALQVSTRDSVEKCLLAFRITREQRREEFQRTYEYDIAMYEDYFEKVEGSARYMEFAVLNSYAQQPAADQLAQVDTLFHHYNDYKNFDFHKEPWLFKTQRSAKYFYATGFNQLRVLDKLKINYKKAFFSTNKSPYSFIAAIFK
ncbi:hypothetical protein [Chitinophaga skermanii]|nr:hypothetical protein [Chitinophaga skermanii]